MSQEGPSDDCRDRIIDNLYCEQGWQGVTIANQVSSTFNHSGSKSPSHQTCERVFTKPTSHNVPFVLPA